MTTSRKEKNNVFLSSTALCALLALALAGGEANAQAKPKPKPAPKARAAAVPANPGFKAADAGYKAYERKEYAEAVQHAEEAVRLAPSQRPYWVLLVNSLVASGRLTDAEQALQRGVQAAGEDAVFAEARATLRRSQAQAAGSEMYRALQNNDIPKAIAQARAATEYAPEHPAYRLALVHALLRGQQYPEAERVASETIALLPDSAVPLALRAYARQRQNRWPDARADYDRALAQRGLTPAAQRELRLIAADASIFAGEPARALELLQPLPANDAAAAQRVALARSLARSPASGQAIAFAPPTIDCTSADAAQTCAVVAAAVPATPGYQAAAAGYRAMEAHDYATALAQARAAATAAPGNRDYQLLLMNAAIANQRYEEADVAASTALAMNANDAPLLAQRASIRRSAGNLAGAQQDAQQALAIGGLPAGAEAGLLADLGRTAEARAKLAAAQGSMTPVDLGYLASRVGDDKLASAAFAQADQAKALPVTALQDAGYAAVRARQDAQAVEYFKRAIDANEAMQLKMDPQMQFATRRTISELERKWGVLASVTYSRSGTAGPGFGVTSPGSIRTTQAGAEAYWRPWGFMNGRFVELFIRGFETLDSQRGGVTGGDSFEGAAGIRWKPLSTQNVVLSFSRLFGNATSDWLAQAAFSHDVGGDLRVDVPSWWTTRIAAEVGRYISPTHTYALGSVLVGRSYRMGDGRWVVLPHGVLAAEYDSTLNEKSAFGAGIGVSLRRWFREDKYHAPQSYVDLTMQYRAHIGGDDRIKGPYVNALISY
ncbi:NfrA family protein [Ramlibacter albus]|uniref:Tetratricopeptide repeat protein n=1 Tax=Ramlibacter albus TaxID=2079448 RepID=A0A923S2U6_9BURK|nr:tetratricopeptide repeat protein [Ramlibacter albus]MBC5765143.1 tetratricopeptide repeat protein [Ramlibacter albus]